MDPSTGMSYLQNQIQHIKLGEGSENRVSVQGLNFRHLLFKIAGNLMTACFIEGAHHISRMCYG